MKHSLLPVLVLLATAAGAEDIPNPLIDYPAFEQHASLVGAIRAERRLTEAQFLALSRDSATVVLDARSAEKFALLHVKGAKNLSLPDMTEEELAKIIPTKNTRVLIYCNNNFRNEPAAFPTKIAPASLNIHTFNVLFAYGYNNVYELGPLLDVATTRIPFEGTRRVARR